MFYLQSSEIPTICCIPFRFRKNIYRDQYRRRFKRLGAPSKKVGVRERGGGGVRRREESSVSPEHPIRHKQGGGEKWDQNEGP